MKHEGDDVAGNENPGEVFSIEASECWCVEIDTLAEHDVDDGAVEDGSLRDANDLGDEGTETPGVDPEEYARNVSGNFVCAAENHAPHHASSLPAEPEIDMNRCGESEDRSKDDVGWQRGTVAVYALFSIVT